MTETDRRIVVGFDGSEGSHRALDWAAKEAEFRGASLTVVQAWTPGEFGRESEREEWSQTQLEEELGSLLKEGLVSWSAVARKGSAAKVLIDESDGADMLVVGSRGHGGFAGLHLGSVSQQVSAHARSTTVVVVKGL